MSTFVIVLRKEITVHVEADERADAMEKAFKLENNTFLYNWNGAKTEIVNIIREGDD